MRYLASTAVLLMVSTRVLAVPVEWTLTDIKFVAPATFESVTGSFTYDADTLSVTNVSLGYAFAGPFLYGVDVSGNGSMIVFTESAVTSVTDLDTYSGAAMVLGFTSALTNAGVETLLVEALEVPSSSLYLLDNPSQIVYCSGGIDNCIYPVGVYSPSISGQSGSIVGTVVPIPAAFWMFGSALAGLGWLNRRQSNS